jgi:SpoVK/Ycf46/Vps4 family AAA+-type ATPase
MGPVALVIDESDRSFGNGEGGDSDGGTSSRIIARLKEFMSDTDNRGQVLFIMMTNRPDKLDTDIKRPGRLDRKIPFFYAETVEDLRSIATVLCNRYGVSAEPLQSDTLVLGMKDYSNADIEALVGLYANNVQLDPDGNVVELFTHALVDFIPPRESGMITYMNLLAVKEASRKSLVPEKYHHLYEGSNLSTALAEAKRALY